MPDLYIIAGPNGAGKSTYSSLLVPLYLNVFDADKLLYEREKLYPDIEPWRLMEGITDNLFESEISKAIGSKSDFAFETNFSSDDPLNTADRFRKAGYHVNLIYIGLESVKAAIARVMHRTSMGGHNVENDEIISRYNAGIRNLQKHLSFFDKAIIYASQRGMRISTPRVVYELKKGIIMQRNLPIPRWARELPVQELAPDRTSELHQKRGRRR
jgi:predicted ABC-type ATPase